MEAHGAAQRPGKVSIPPVPQFSSLSGPRSGRAVLRLVAVPRDRPVEASLENLHSIPDPQSHDPLLWNGKNSPQHSSGAGLNEPLPGMAGNKRHAAFRLLPLIGARVAPLGPASSGSLRSASPSSSPWVDISTLSPQSPDFWRLGSGPQAATQAADQAASADTVLVLRRLDSGLVDLSGLLLALGHPTLLHGLIACELAEAELGLSPSGPHGAILTPPSPAPPELCLPAMSVPDAAWVPPPVARRCIDLIRRKRLLANPNRHHRRGKDSPYRPSYLGPFAPPGASVASTPSSATPDLEEAIGPWQLLGCLTDANSEYMRVWYKEVDGEPGAEGRFKRCAQWRLSLTSIPFKPISVCCPNLQHPIPLSTSLRATKPTTKEKRNGKHGAVGLVTSKSYFSQETR